MNTQLLSFIGLYLFVTLLIGYWASRRVKNTRDFAIAGRHLPTSLAACALFATWFGSETIMGASSEFVEHGLLGVIEDPFGAAMCLILIGVFFARPLYRLNIITFSDFFRLRFGKTSEFISAVFMVPSYFGWIAAQLVALAIVLKTVAGIPILYGILVCTLVVVIYTYIGGMWAVSITDAVQTVMIIAGLLMLAYLLAEKAGGVSAVIASTPEGFFRFIPEPTGRDWLAYFAAWITIGLGSIPQQDVFQRVVSARTEQTAVNASYISGFMYLTIAFLPMFIGLSGRLVYPDALADDSQMMIPMMVLRHGNLLLQIMFFGALLSAILSTTSGAILAPATVLGENLIRPLLRNPTDRIMLRTMRWSVVAVAAFSAWMAFGNSDIYELVGTSSALSLVSLFIPLTGGLYWKRASRWGAILSMVIGMGVWILAEFVFSWEVASLIPGTLGSIAGMLAGSWLIPDASYQQFLRDKEVVDTVLSQ